MEKSSLVLLQLTMEVELRTLGGLTIPIERSSTPSQNPYTDPSMMESENDKSLGQSTLQQTSLKRLNTNDTAIAQREREINDIAQGIIELADIFKELQGMVIDQGTMLDRIDYNIENMAVNVKAADKELNVVRSFATTFTVVCSTNRLFAGHGLSTYIYEAKNLVPTLPSRHWDVYPLACKTKAVKSPCYLFAFGRW